ncbi:MAG: ROK family protein [Armatimonadota bacterium]
MSRIGIDIGGTSAKLALVSDDGEVLRRGRVATDRDLPGEELVRSLARAAWDLLPEEGVPALGVAAPGCRRDDGEGVVNVTNLPHIDGFPLRRRLEENTGIETVLDNDANAAAMGEYRYGAGQGAERVLVVTVGTGIGAGMVVRGNVHRVSWQGLGDPGHVIVAPDGPRCACGARGCAEAVAAVPGLVRRAEALRGAPVRSVGEVAQEARSGADWALAALGEAGRHLGIALVTMTHLLGPDRILLGGGGVDATEELLLRPVERTFREYIQPFFGERVTLGRAALGNDAGVIGAAALASHVTAPPAEAS